MTSTCKNYFSVQMLFSSTSVNPLNIHHERMLSTNSALCCKQKKPREIAEVCSDGQPRVRNLISDPASSHGHPASKDGQHSSQKCCWQNRDTQFMFILRNLFSIDTNLYMQDNVYKLYAIKLLCVYNKAQNYCNAIWTEQGKKHWS